MGTNTLEISEEEVNRRFVQVINELKAQGKIQSDYSLRKIIGKAGSFISRLLGGQSAHVDGAMIGRLCEHFPEVNPLFLLGTMDGPIFISAEGSNARPIVAKWDEVPFVDTPLLATFSDWGDSVPAQYERIPVFNLGEDLKGKVVAFPVVGDSMEPQIMDKAKVLCKLVPLGDWKYLSSGVYAVLYNGSFTIKRVKENEMTTKGILTLHADNPRHGFLPIPADDIRGIWKVLRVLESPVL